MEKEKKKKRKTLQERIAEEEKIIEKIDKDKVKWRKVYSGGGKHYENWLSQFKELVNENDIRIEEIDSTGFKCFENEKMYRVWIKVK